MQPLNIQNLLGLSDKESRAASPSSTIELSSDSRSQSPTSTILLSSDDEETFDAEEVGKSLRINIFPVFFHDYLYAFVILITHS